MRMCQRATFYQLILCVFQAQQGAILGSDNSLRASRVQVQRGAGHLIRLTWQENRHLQYGCGPFKLNGDIDFCQF